MIRVETLVIVILYSVKIKSTGIEFSTDVAEFENAKTLCSSDYQVAGTDFFNRCQPKNCEKIDLKGHEINFSMVADTTQILWIGAYVVRSPVMQYKGCYKVNGPTRSIQQLNQQQNDTDNDVLKCSRFCNSKGYAQRGYVILLQGYKCYCAKKSLGTWKKNGEVDEVSTNVCSKDCPGDVHVIDRCGGKNPHIVAAYEFKGDKDGEADTYLGNKCFYTAPNKRASSVLLSGNCFQELKFRCQMVDISDGSKKVLTKRCYSIRLNWYDAQLKCLEHRNYLPTYTPSNDICISQADVDEENNWHNAFVKERIVWEIEKKPRFNHKCFAIGFRKDGNFTFLALNCTDKYKAFCIRKATTETTTHSNAQQETTNTKYAAKTTTYSNAQQETTNTKYAAKKTTVTGFVTVSGDRLPRAVDMHNPSSSKSKVEMYIAVPLTVAVLIVSVIITVICIKRRRKRKTNENENKENMSAVYYSTVPDEVTLKRSSDLPLADANGACLVNETDVYNHLGDTDQQNHSDVTGPVYDHTGLQDNDQYDISVISEKRTNKDGDDLNHYDLMQVSADINSVYDETSTARTTNDDKSIDSVDIYDHAKQTESDYDTTDTQQQHEQRDHVHEPTYDQSGSCENPCEPTYDQSGPCEHLTDPMYDQSDSLGADIYEKCETKQSSIDEQ